jgi:hypothetical protein
MNDRRRALSGAGLISALFLALHLPYLPQSLEDLDSINFALGVRQFDVTHHQPHPPGYPVFILAAKTMHALVPSEARALALVGVFAGALGVLALFALFAAFDRRDSDAPAWALGATAVAATAPLYWLTASRPLSDMAGLAASVAIQALTLTATGEAGVVIASGLSGFAIGLRSQAFWLTVPLLIFVIARRARPARVRCAAAFAVGVIAWSVPLVVLTGGPAAYWRAVFNQGNEDLSNIVMLWTTHTPKEFELAAYQAFVSPWALPAVAAIVLVLATLGVFQTLRRRSPALALLAVAFGPYLVFDLVFQETITTRYALPLVVPVAYLAVRGAAMLGPAPAVAIVVVLSLFDAHIGGTSLAAYASQPAPAFRMLEGMKSEASRGTVSTVAPVLAMHRREEADLRRAIAWAGVPVMSRHLPATAKHEWLDLVKYWNGGGRAPVWFVADPLRSDLALVGSRDTPEMFRWTLDYPGLIGGTRPGEMDWYVVTPPDWYLGEGWAVTPETAGIAMEDHRGPGYAPIQGWVKRWVSPATLMIGGRNLAAGGAAMRVTVRVDGRVVDENDVAPGFFIQMIDLPASALSGDGDYATVTVSAEAVDSGTVRGVRLQPDLAIEQFDAQPTTRVLTGYGDGWHEQEYSPATGRLWRWTSDHAVLRVRTPQQALVLSLKGEVEAAAKSHVTIKAGDRIVAAYDIGSTFAIRQTIPRELVTPGETTITITTDTSYVPAERSGRTKDRRLLGLKVYESRVTAVTGAS